jgi:hypothetical protein
MKITKLPVLTGLLISLSLTALSQAASEKATIYRDDSAPQTGYVKNESLAGTPQTFVYSEKEGNVMTPLAMGPITRIVFENGRVLERHRITIQVINKTLIDRVQQDYSDAALRLSGGLLVERAIDGPFSFYIFNDTYGYAHYFYRQAAVDTALVYLTNRSYTDLSSSSYRLDESYKDRLAFIAAGASCSAVRKLASRTPYTLKGLNRFFVELNTCNGANVSEAQELKASRPKLGFFVTGGVDRYQSVYLDNATCLSPAFGGGLILTPHRGLSNASIEAEVVYQSMTFDQVKRFPNQDRRIESEVKSTTINGNLTGNYTKAFGKQAFSLGTGPSFDCILSNSQQVREIYPPEVKVSTSKGSTMFVYGWFVQGGYAFGRLSFKVHYRVMPLKRSFSYDGPGLYLRYRLR